jgi:hypothetical protein
MRNGNGNGGGMNIREKLREKPAVSVAFAVCAVGIAFIFIGRGAVSGPQRTSSNVFYTTDEGQTVFVDDMTRVPPFDYNGKTAYRVWMYTADGGKTKFPGYLERYTPEAKKRLEAAAAAAAKDGDPHGGPGVGPADIEIRKPGEGNPWVSRANLAEAAKITNVRAPNGSGELDIVMP